MTQLLWMIYSQLWFRYVVISDPPGVKVGSGGSTLHCLEHMLKIFGNECLNYCELHYALLRQPTM